MKLPITTRQILQSCLLLTMSWLLIHHAHAKSLLKQPNSEFEVKAAYLYNFSQTIAWPPATFNTGQERIVFCVLGRTPVLNELHSLGQEVGYTLPIMVFQTDEVTATEGCHILFIARSEQPEIITIIDYLYAHQRPILTVSDIPEFVEQGGMIKFYMNPHYEIRIAIDPETISEAGLLISRDLFNVSERIYRP